MTWYDLKGRLTDTTGVSNDALHLPLGLLAYLFSPRSCAAGLWALLPVVALQVFNEVLDARDWWHWTGTIKWSEAWTDTLATLALPAAVAASWMMWRRASL